MQGGKKKEDTLHKGHTFLRKKFLASCIVGSETYQQQIIEEHIVASFPYISKTKTIAFSSYMRHIIHSTVIGALCVFNKYAQN